MRYISSIGQHLSTSVLCFAEGVQSGDPYHEEFNPAPDGGRTGMGKVERVVAVQDPSFEKEQVQNRIASRSSFLVVSQRRTRPGDVYFKCIGLFDFMLVVARRRQQADLPFI